MIRRTFAGACALAISLLALSSCRNRGLPRAGSKEYGELVRAFNVGLAGLQSGEDVRAKSGLTKASELAPGEPASFANLGILALRQQEFDAAWQHMAKAHSLAPDNSRIEQFLGEIESRRGKLPEAIAHFRKAVELDGKNLKATYALTEQIERQGTGSSDSEALGLLKRLLEAQPSNTSVLLDAIRLGAKAGDAATVKTSLERLRQASASWSDEARKRFEDLAQSATDLRKAGIQAAFLRNVLLREPGYRQDANAVKTPAVFAGEPFVRFLRVASPASEPAAPDAQTTFTSQRLPMESNGVVWVRIAFLDESEKPAVLWADGAGIHVDSETIGPVPGGSQESSVAVADLDYDFKADIVVAGAGGLRVYRQEESRRFKDVSSQTRLPKPILTGSYTGAWPLDVDLDGDLDIVVGVTGGAPIGLRNNGDGTFAIVRPFPSVNDAVAFAAADLDGDGDPDPAFVDTRGRLTAWTNERLGLYRLRAVPPEFAEGVANITATDSDSDGLIDLVVLKLDGTVMRLSDQNDGRAWQTAVIVKAQAGARTLISADFDNNGALDFLIGSRVYLGDGRGISPLNSALDLNAFGVVDLNQDGRLDVVGIAGSGPAVFVNRGSKDYKWQVIRTRAANATGDQRINSFGLGGEIEIRAGLLTQKQTITTPVLHFGLGEQPQSDLARIVWPNGLIQVEFELKANQSILAAQRLKGSCPSLFAWDGSRMAFVKDGAPWSPALGLHINAQQVAGIYQTEEWFKIPGHQLAARDGYYDLRITAELWETYYIDHYSLLMVDHPAGTEIYTDERFAIPPPALQIVTTKSSRPFARAADDKGKDISKIVADADRIYLDTFGRGQYQGVTRDHWVELELPTDAPNAGPLYLIAEGWMHPTDATVNIALGQTSNAPPDGLRIEVPDKTGRWVTARSGLGFPAGKLKTIVLDISTVFKPGAARKLRLGTNMEIYWDRLAWAEKSAAELRTTKLPVKSADLRYRGFSAMKAANASSPELPEYETLEATGQKWRDLEGYYTRYGDIRPLLERVDDRMVIVNAGDEMRFRFASGGSLAPGWKRDFVMIGDGWIKDGDYNSVFSKTVLPLPYHGLKDYVIRPRNLEDDIAYRKHPLDWEHFHTRYVAPDFFRRSLWNRQ